MIHLRRPHLPPSTSRVARRVLGGVLLWGVAHGAFAQGPATVQVAPGDTASALVLPWLPEGATLDQMLVALLRANPEAFIEGNVNLLRAGQTLQLPEAAQVLRTSADQARETVLDHHSRFREHAQRLAAQAHTLPEGPAREIAGKVRTAADGRPGTGTGEDRLLLTKDLQDAQALKIAVEKQTQEAMAHLAALQKNIEQLQRLSRASEPQAASAPSPTLPVWAWIAGIAIAALTLVIGLRRRDAPTSQPPSISPPVVVPPQIAGLSLDLDSPGAGTDRRP